MPILRSVLARTLAGTAVTLLLAAGCAAGNGAGAAHPAPSSPAPSSPAAPGDGPPSEPQRPGMPGLHCPQRLRSAMDGSTARHADTRRTIDPTTIAMSVCAYGAGGGRTSANPVDGTRKQAGSEAGRASRMLGLLQAQRVAAPGLVCTMDLGPRYLVNIFTAQGGRITFTVDTAGCRYVTPVSSHRLDGIEARLPMRVAGDRLLQRLQAWASPAG